MAQSLSFVSQKRLVSLDALRGFTIAAMLMVNNTVHDQAYPSWFRHAPWGGRVTFCDLIFPWFLYCVGVAIPFSYGAFRAKGGTHLSYLTKAARRAGILVLLGIVLVSSTARRVVVGLDVLQLIGLAYLVGACAYALSPALRTGLAVLLLAAHWVLLSFVPFAGCPGGTLLPDCNIISYVNDKYLAQLHLAGAVSVVPTGALVCGGSIVGDILRSGTGAVGSRVRTLAFIGLACTGGGLLLGLQLPLIKALWTASFVLFAVGIATVLLALFHWLIEGRGYKSWAFPFVVFGMNAITAYFLSVMVRVHTLQEWQVQVGGTTMSVREALWRWLDSVLGATAASWTYTCAYVLVWWLILYWMYRRRIFWKI
ncbi:MAG: DUF5009 domain-containing protein [candidate division KSB1 bacterium]|nr:DUF5009 domain-containing protein [candidate division KSB1 bacterium]MDZ7392075.1 DUF5009 domain-containing protein [candidate division KSB1 bacterium]MDZ7411950.1 DUF5009 domain-containing protein [candidate division KSB1 bacterium]